jgi:hypothetical protein
VSWKAASFFHWIPYLVAVGLMAVGIAEAVEVAKLRQQKDALAQQLNAARADAQRLRESYGLVSLRLTALDAKDPAYAGARVMVAWDAHEHRGSIALEQFPPMPAGRDYQLWVLDPNAPTPLNAGVVSGARPFSVAAVSVAQPGFALSLEPAGGSPTLTGPILFAVAPAE